MDICKRRAKYINEGYLGYYDFKTMCKLDKDKPYLASINDSINDNRFTRFCIEEYMKKKFPRPS
jgi:hypothetical protein